MLRLTRLAAGVFVAAAMANAGSRGYLTTPQELTNIRERAAFGAEPYRSAVRDTLMPKTLSYPCQTGVAWRVVHRVNRSS